MGTLEELGYEPKPPNAARRAMQKVASTKPAAWMFQRTLYPIDKMLFRWSDGRTTAASMLAGLPVVLLTTTGAKTGQDRTMPLLAVPVDDDVAVIGSNYGQQATPGWVYNLEADPSARLGYRGVSVEVTARRVDADEADRIFGLAAGIYPGYTKYRERVTHREIRVFILESAAD